MNLHKYIYYTNQSFTDYEFDSIGSKGKIRKVARFTKIDENLFNFGFGDLDEETGDISDTAVSNNGDAKKVLATVAAIVCEFTDKYPNSTIFIKGSTPARTRWYQMNIAAYLEEISALFEIKGVRNKEWEIFKKNSNYDAFIGIRKVFK
jgi:hypothetical protein